MMKALKAISVIVTFYCFVQVTICTPPVRPGAGNPRLPRTSASQLSQLNNGTRSPTVKPLRILRTR